LTIPEIALVAAEAADMTGAKVPTVFDIACMM
jgi:hypothetical protein